jgi:CMP-N-acetylneuraminic acid synthetase
MLEKIKNNFILGVIPARGGSKGVYKKNIKLLSNKPLIEFTIDAAKNSKFLSDFIVSTDDKEIKSLSESLGVSVPFIRPSSLSGDLALATDTMRHALLSYEQINNVRVDTLVMLQPTAPLRTSSDIDNSMSVFLTSKADSLISIVNVGNNHPFKMKTIKDGNLFDYVNTGLENPPRQSLPPIYIVNGALYIVKRNTLVEQFSFKGNFCIPYEMPPERSVNIDSEIDFVIAEYYLNLGRIND